MSQKMLLYQYGKIFVRCFQDVYKTIFFFFDNFWDSYSAVVLLNGVIHFPYLKNSVPFSPG